MFFLNAWQTRKALNSTMGYLYPEKHYTELLYTSNKFEVYLHLTQTYKRFLLDVLDKNGSHVGGETANGT